MRRHDTSLQAPRAAQCSHGITRHCCTVCLGTLYFLPHPMSASQERSSPEPRHHVVHTATHYAWQRLRRIQPVALPVSPHLRPAIPWAGGNTCQCVQRVQLSNSSHCCPESRVVCGSEAPQ
jgi:hypothetical protein